MRYKNPLLETSWAKPRGTVVVDMLICSECGNKHNPELRIYEFANIFIRNSESCREALLRVDSITYPNIVEIDGTITEAQVEFYRLIQQYLNDGWDVCPVARKMK